MSVSDIKVVETAESRRTGMGVEIEGLDASRPMDAETVAAVRKVMLQYPVVVLHGQSLTPEQLTRFGGAFGILQPHTAERYHHPEFKELSYISNIGADGKVDEFGHNKRATGWHSDGSFLEVPYSFTLLYALESPSEGGPTCFSSTELAYNNLPEDLRRRADEAIAVHALASGVEGATAPSAQKRRDHPELFPEIERPAVQVHPETGRKAIFVNPTHTSHIKGEDRDAPGSLYRTLIEFCIRPEFVYEHKWRVGDIVIWDQRCTMHRAGGGLKPTDRRVMLRALVRGLDKAA